MDVVFLSRSPKRCGFETERVVEQFLRAGLEVRATEPLEKFSGKGVAPIAVRHARAEAELRLEQAQNPRRFGLGDEQLLALLDLVSVGSRKSGAHNE